MGGDVDSFSGGEGSRTHLPLLLPLPPSQVPSKMTKLGSSLSGLRLPSLGAHLGGLKSKLAGAAGGVVARIEGLELGNLAGKLVPPVAVGMVVISAVQAGRTAAQEKTQLQVGGWGGEGENGRTVALH